MSVSLEQIMSDARLLQARLTERGKLGEALHFEVGDRIVLRNCLECVLTLYSQQGLMIDNLYLSLYLHYCPFDLHKIILK